MGKWKAQPHQLSCSLCPLLSLWLNDTGYWQRIMQTLQSPAGRLIPGWHNGYWNRIGTLARGCEILYFMAINVAVLVDKTSDHWFDCRPKRPILLAWPQTSPQSVSQPVAHVWLSLRALCSTRPFISPGAGAAAVVVVVFPVLFSSGF